ncbi:acylneuraminate cytidylyltransferase family protein [Magnetovibrio sp. PR-2]|uniref:acylneuraminate cytidylyltransferase family protein n=1 Tax=Magnetovibrio sp. PR-2 TaxID=3120356 RepID=UPI002FCE5CD6
MTVWGLIPARGGSKSIPLKNLVDLDGRPLLDYGATAALKSGRFDRIVCSTDHDGIAARATELGIDVDRRPDTLSGDTAKVDKVAQDFLLRAQQAGRTLPDIVVLIQPTSPFLLPEHVCDLIDLLNSCDWAQSAHNYCPVPHNTHAWNQRTADADGKINFLFAKERQSARNKQEKPALKVFGNLIAARSSALLDGRGFYAEPCAGCEVERPYEFDLDEPLDLVLSHALIQAGAVSLPHMQDR